MITKHFFKILLIFLGMILLGIVGSYLVSSMDKDKNENKTLPPASIVK